MRSVPGYLARLAAAGHPGGTAALRPPRSLFAPGGGPTGPSDPALALAGTGDEARPPRPAPAPAPLSGGATTTEHHDGPAAPGASEPRQPRGPVSPTHRHRQPADGAGPPDVGPVIIPPPARRAGPAPGPDRPQPHSAPGPDRPQPRLAPGPDRPQPRLAPGQASAATAERPSRPAPGPGRGEQPARLTSATPAVTANQGQQAAATPAPAGLAAHLTPWTPEPGKSAREDGPAAAEPAGAGPSASSSRGSAQGPSYGRPHRAAAPIADPGPIAELVPSPAPRSAREATSHAPASGPAPHGGGPARVTIGTIEVTVVPPPPAPTPATTGPTWAPGRQRPTGDVARRAARRCFGTGQS
jgi:hypothetical protein